MSVLQIREQNRLAREAHKAASDAHRAAALENKRRLALHNEELQAAALQLAAANEAALQQARQEYKVCALLVAEAAKTYDKAGAATCHALLILLFINLVRQPACHVGHVG